MTVCWFALFRHTTAPQMRASDADLLWLMRFVAATPGLQQALIYTPSSTSDPYLDDGPPPQLGLQLYFADIQALEAATADDGYLQGLAAPGALPSLDGANVSQQAMLVRRYPVPDGEFRTPTSEPPCTYLVAYEGEAEDLAAWLTHYIADHPPIMARFPGIRQIEIYTCIDWSGGLPWPRVEHMQRNKVVFDSQAALTAALNSPVRHEMRAAFARFPRFSGPITHFPMASKTVTPQRG
jgi:uncharacterized protein (TIGR02118 family)